MISGQCFDFRLLVCGGDARRDQIASQLSGAVVEACGETAQIVHFDFDVRDCPDAAMHRVHMFVLEPHDHFAWEPYISKRCLQQADVCVLVESQENREVIEDVSRWCRIAGVKLLVVFYAKPSFSCDAQFIVVDGCTDDVLSAAGDCFREAHSERSFAKDLQLERRLLSLSEQDKYQHKCDEIGLPPTDATVRVCHCDDVDFTFTLAMAGSPNSGKTTFLSATLDDFVILDYEPTRRSEFGTFSVHAKSLGSVNMTLVDGPTRQSFNDAHAYVCFVDLSTRDGIDNTQQLMSQLVSLHKPIFLLGTKVDLCASPEVHVEALRGLASGTATSSISYTVIDAREPHLPLLASIAVHLAQKEKRLQGEVAQLLNDAARRCTPSVNYTQLCGRGP